VGGSIDDGGVDDNGAWELTERRHMQGIEDSLSAPQCHGARGGVHGDGPEVAADRDCSHGFLHGDDLLARDEAGQTSWLFSAWLANRRRTRARSSSARP
jgi:hypothetical protein